MDTNISESSLNYESILCQIVDSRVRFHREVTFFEMHKSLAGAVSRKLLKVNQKVTVWIKGYPDKRLQIIVPKFPLSV